MVPGGFIESRDFSHISPVILGTFNVFLTTLGMVSLFLVYFIHKRQKWAFWAAFLCGLSYFIVYVTDLTKLFPQSPTPMPPALFVLEVLGTVLAIPLMYFAVKGRRENRVSGGKPMSDKTLYGLIGLAVLIGLGIIIFATKAAMSGN